MNRRIQKRNKQHCTDLCIAQAAHNAVLRQHSLPGRHHHRTAEAGHHLHSLPPCLQLLPFVDWLWARAACAWEDVLALQGPYAKSLF